MKVDQDVIEVLDRATTSGNSLVLVGQLDRKLYERAAKALDAAGGKWNRKAGAHLFEGDAAEAIDPILLTGEIVSAKREFDAFYTPPGLAEEIIRRAGIVPTTRVLEPSAGECALVVAALAVGAEVTAVDVRPGLAERAAKLAPAAIFIKRDFLTMTPDEIGPFDAVVMNPPFSRQQDIRHVRHAARFIQDGRLIAIMSASVTFRDNTLTREFRAWVDANRGGMTPLPDGSFKVAGTNVNSVVVDLEF